MCSGATTGYSVKSWRTVVYAVGVAGLGTTPVWLLSAFAPQIGEALGFDSVGLGLIIGSFFAVSAITGLTSGRIVASLGWRNGIVLSALSAALSMGAIALFTHNWVVLVLMLALGAVANSISQPAANLAVASAVTHGRQGLALGIKQAAIPIATFLVGVSVPLFERGSDWRLAFAAAACMALLLVLVTGTPRRRALLNWQTGGVATLRRHLAASSPRNSSTGPVPHALVLLAAGAGFGTAATMSLGGFLVVYAVDRGLTLSESGRLLAVGSAVGILSRVLSGYLADLRGRRHLIVVAAMMLVGSVGLCILAFADGLPMLVAGTVLAFGLGWAWFGVFDLSVVRYSAGSPAVATGVAMTAMSLGAMIGPVAFGLAAAWSYSAAWLGCAVALVVGAGFMLVGRRELSR